MEREVNFRSQDPEFEPDEYSSRETSWMDDFYSIFIEQLNSLWPTMLSI